MSMPQNIVKISGTAEINDEGIKKLFKNTEPWEAIFQLAWNGFDANAKNVSIIVTENELSRAESVTVLDDGDGIDVNNIDNNFGRFNDSSKKEDITQHGYHGRGRLSFHRLSDEAIWYTKSENLSKEAFIKINSTNIKSYDGREILNNKEQHSLLSKQAHGTCVELLKLFKNLPDMKKFKELLAVEFGWYLTLNTDRILKLNNSTVSVPAHDAHTKRISINKFSFDLNVIRWHERPSSEKSYIYLVNNTGKIVHKTLSSFNNKVNFYSSIYIQSNWADYFEPDVDPLFADKNGHHIHSSTWAAVQKHIAEFTQDVYNEYLKNLANETIDNFIKDGIFPSYSTKDAAYAEWRLENTKAIVRSVYIADPTVFSALNKKQKKIIVRLLDKLSVSNENDSLFEVLNSVLELDKETLDIFAKQLQKTSLENIISTIEMLQGRQSVINKLRELMNNHYKEVRETPDLQKIIENNTWLFGHQYETLGAEEDTFTKIAKNLRDNIKNINMVEAGDVDDGGTIIGANKQCDLFLARKIPRIDSYGKQYYQCIVIEIKRPSVSLNVKHLRQLDDYAGIIKKHPEFSSEHMHFELILVGRKISSADSEINSRIHGQKVKGEMGLVTDDENMKRYVLNWYTLLDGLELSYGFMLEKLNLKRDSLMSLNKKELVEELQKEHI